MSKSGISRLAKTARIFINRHSPEILTGMGIAGMVATTVLAVKATPKAIKLLEARKEELETDKLTPTETVLTTWKCYIPSAVTGATSIACLIGASSVNVRRNAALAAAYNLSTSALAEYKEKVVDTIGENKERTVRDKVAQSNIDNTPIKTNEVVFVGNGETYFLDPLSKRYIKSNIDTVNKIENTLNKQILHDFCGSVSLNEFYDELGLERTDLGDEIGWNTDNLIDLDIRVGTTPDGNPCFVIGHNHPPKWGF